VALLGILMLGGVVHGVGAIKANVERSWPRFGKDQAWAWIRFEGPQLPWRTAFVREVGLPNSRCRGIARPGLL